MEGALPSIKFLPQQSCTLPTNKVPQKMRNFTATMLPLLLKQNSQPFKTLADHHRGNLEP